MADPRPARTPAEVARLLGEDRFVTAPGELAARLARCRAVVLDWDGVLGSGHKGAGFSESFNEIDTMGLNLLRFALWLRGGSGAVPPVVIVSGQHQAAAQALADRDRLDALYLGFLDKRLALEHLCRTRGLSPAEVMFVFDDVLDLGMAERCGARFLVGRPGQPMLEAFVRSRGLCDYVVRAPAAGGAVREACEGALALLGEDERVFQARGWYEEVYQRYLEARRAVPAVARFSLERDASGVATVRAV